MTSTSGQPSFTKLPDALADALARVVVDVRRDFDKDLSLLSAEGRSFMAELTARRMAIEEEIRAAVEARVSEALASIKNGEPGAPGKDGAKGDPGERGEKGEQGPQGEPGKDGTPGRDGVDGKDGFDGADGKDVDLEEVVARLIPEIEKSIAAIPIPEDGKDGRDGIDGKDGAPGPPGQFSPPKSFVDGAVYYEGDLVCHDGSTWCARTDTAKQPPHDDWAPVALRGAPAPVPEVKGLFDPGGEYRKLSIVAHNGASWIATKDSPDADIPGDGWSLLAQKGKRGDRGEKGERGPQGLPGKDGKPGASVESLSVEGWSIVAVTSDGKKLSVDLRPLFERYQEEGGG